MEQTIRSFTSSFHSSILPSYPPSILLFFHFVPFHSEIGPRLSTEENEMTLKMGKNGCAIRQDTIYLTVHKFEIHFPNVRSRIFGITDVSNVL